MKISKGIPIKIDNVTYSRADSLNTGKSLKMAVDI